MIASSLHLRRTTGLTVGLLLWLPCPGHLRASDDDRAPADAMAFIRVVGDLRAEFVGVWRQPVVRENVEFATGSGFVIAPSGLVLTNHHVVDDAPVVRRIGRHEAEVRLEDRRIEVGLGREGSLGVYEGWVVAADPELDLAVLQVTASELPYIPFGDSDASEPGSAVRVLGFPFGRQAAVGKRNAGAVVPRAAVTTGSLSAARADEAGSTRFLQTDASVNPGSSGGPMVDEDGYAVAVVRMKLAHEATGAGAGFGVPINVVKDFLEAHGLLEQLPAERLYPGVVHTLDWKGMRVELPDGFADTSPARLLVDTEDSEGSLRVRVARVATPWELGSLEQALLQGTAWPGFAPGRVGERGPSRESGTRILGSAEGERENGGRFRVDYALLDLGPEKVLAQCLGPPDALAFNLSLVRRSLQNLEAVPLLTDEVDAPLSAPFEPVAYPAGAAGGVLLPEGWSHEPASHAVCSKVPVAEAGLAASPGGDFTVVFRALRWTGPVLAPHELARACGQTAGVGSASYAGRFERLGVAVGVWGTFLERGDDVLLLEAEAPESKLPHVRELYGEWVARVAE